MKYRSKTNRTVYSSCRWPLSSP